MKHTAFFITILLLAACQTTSGAGNGYQAYLDRKGLSAPTQERFPHCRAYGCHIVDSIQLTAQDWSAIAAPFTNIQTAEEERQSIAAAIGLFEQKVGARNGTSADKRGTFSGVGAGNTQHDCVDESVNTTIYLALLAQQNLIKFHTVASPVSRTPATTILSGKLWPHQTAVVIEKETGQRFAIDSWFHDNGAAAEIISLNQWYRGWNPD